MNLNNGDNQLKASCCSAFWVHQSKLAHWSQQALWYEF